MAEAVVNPDEIASLIPLLVPMPEQKRLAAELRALLEKGDTTAASQKLTTAVEVGTLASILLDWINFPALLPALRALPDVGGETAPAPNAAQSTGGDRKELTALNEALERERLRSAALSDELSTMKSDFFALKTSREQDIASASATTEDLTAALKRQEERAEAATRQVADISQELAALKSQREKETASVATDTGSLAKALKAQEERANATARELAQVNQELATLRSQRDKEASAAAATAADLEKSRKGEEERAGASARDLRAATKELESRRASHERDLASSASTVSELQQALAREKARADDANRELAASADDLRKLRSARQIPRMLGLERPLPTGADVTAEQLPAPPATGALAAPVAVPAPAPAAPAASSPTDDRLTARADMLFRSGDVSGARLLLERAQEAGNAQAIFLLAETFDPNALAAIGAVGIRSDKAHARELYGRALALGIDRAGARIEALK
jgi:predicted  nucleic acid-binding Zn-ribbon protein